jgi:hypothetical protein
VRWTTLPPTIRPGRGRPLRRGPDHLAPPERALVLQGDAGGLYRVTWAFALEPIDARTTRLLVRASGDYERRSVGVMLQATWRPMHFAMQRKQLLTLRKRIEAASAVSSGS